MVPCIVFNVVHRNDEWHVLKGASSDPEGRYKSKPDAVEKGRELAMREEFSKLRIGLADGSIQSELAFGKDPVELEGAGSA